MRNRKFIIGFLIFDIALVAVIALFLLIKNPFKRKVAPNTNPTTEGTTFEPGEEATTIPSVQASFADVENKQIYSTIPNLVGMREESVLTDDGRFYTSYKASLDLDMDGDGQIESVSISLDDHSEAFYVLVNDNGAVQDYVIPGLEFTYKEAYGCKACKGALQSFTVDLDSSDKYQEVAVELNRDTWMEYKTIVVRYDGNQICASMVPGKLNGVSNQGEVQFYEYDYMTGRHQLFRTYTMSADQDFLQPQSDFFVDAEVERATLLTTLKTDVQGIDSQSQPATVKAGTSFYWYCTDNETYVEVVAGDGEIYQFPIEKEEITNSTGKEETIYKIAGLLASEF